MQQLSVFLENRAGSLESALAILASANIDIRAMALSDTSDFGILRLIVNEHPKAQELLLASGFTVGNTDVIVLGLEDRPGALLAVVGLLAENNINIEYMYPFACKGLALPGMVMRFDKMEYAREKLAEMDIAEMS